MARRRTLGSHWNMEKARWNSCPDGSGSILVRSCRGCGIRVFRAETRERWISEL